MKSKSKNKFFKVKKLSSAIQFKKTMYGATLIQVFVVIAIIGLIAAYVIAQISNQ